MTIREAINQAIIMLKNENIESPKNKARILLETTLKKTKEYILIYDNKEISNEERNLYIKNVKRLILGEPLQYITGRQEFMKLNFFVTKNVLIPRQDTEILVEEVIKISEKIENPKILDLCTGSGNICVSLAKYISNASIYAVDISAKALEIAKKNAVFNGLKDKITFVESNMFEKLNNEKFNIIVSNPPYIETSTISKLPKDVQKEPKLALDGGRNGLRFYTIIAENAHKYLEKKGYLCLEIGYNQKSKVQKILCNQKVYRNIYSKKDLCENDRVVISQLAEMGEK